MAESVPRGLLTLFVLRRGGPQEAETMPVLRERMTNSRPVERVVKVDGRTVQYQVVGTGKPLVLVHGLSGSSRWWWRNFEELARGYSVYMVDLPGFGAMRQDQEGFVLSEVADWLANWIRAIGIDPVNLVGHSLGGFVCVRVASRHPQLVNCVVLVSPAGVPEDRSLLAYSVTLLRAALQLRPGFAVVLARDFIQAGPRTILRAARDLLNDDICQDLRTIQSPTLLVWGADDPMIPAAVANVFRTEIPRSRVVVFDNTGHVPMIDRAHDFNRVVLEFLDGEPVGE